MLVVQREIYYGSGNDECAEAGYGKKKIYFLRVLRVSAVNKISHPASSPLTVLSRAVGPWTLQTYPSTELARASSLSSSSCLLE